MAYALITAPKNYQNTTPLDFTIRNPGPRECGTICTCGNHALNQRPPNHFPNDWSGHFLSYHCDNNANEIKPEQGTGNAPPLLNPPTGTAHTFSERSAVATVNSQRQFDDPKMPPALIPNASGTSSLSPPVGGGHPVSSSKSSPGGASYPSSSPRSSSGDMGYQSSGSTGASVSEASVPPQQMLAPPPLQLFAAYNPALLPPQGTFLPTMSLNAMISFHPGQKIPSPKTSPESIEEPKDRAQQRGSPVPRSSPSHPKRMLPPQKAAPRKSPTVRPKTEPAAKDPVQMDRRTRNNLAAKRSRDLRRQREDDIAKYCQKLMNMHRRLGEIKAQYVKLIHAK